MYKIRHTISILLAVHVCSSALCINDRRYRLGVGKADITGPAAEMIMMGYGNIHQTTSGILDRLYARAYIIEQPNTSAPNSDSESDQNHVVIVVCDAMAVFQIIHQHVLIRLKQRFHNYYTEQNVVLHATHTHAAPGGTSAYFLYNLSTLGFVKENFELIVNGIVSAIEQAYASRFWGFIRHGNGAVSRGGKNRSPFAYDANPLFERAQYSSNIDENLRLLQFYTEENTVLRGLLAFYAVHSTSLTNRNQLVSGDNRGYATFLIEDRFRKDNVIAAIANSNSADVSPNLVDRGDGTLTGEGKNDIENAEIIGKRLADTIFRILQLNTSVTVRGPVLGKLTYVDFSKVNVQKGKNDTFTRTCPAVVGQNFAAGTEDGRGIEGYFEGDLKPRYFVRTFADSIMEATNFLRSCQATSKVPFILAGIVKPVPWTPDVLPLQIIKLGSLGLAVTNFELTTMAGRYLRRALMRVLSTELEDVQIMGTSNAYAQYVTTKEEYTVQHYEGASTLFGPLLLEAMEQEFTRIAFSIRNPNLKLNLGPSPRKIDISTIPSFHTNVIVDTVPFKYDFGNCLTQAPFRVPIGAVVNVTFYGGHPKNRFQEVQSYCDVEMLVHTNYFETHMRDNHWDLRFYWERRGISESVITCSWYVRKTSRTSIAGRYRIRHRGFAKPLFGMSQSYEGVSDEFTVY